MAKKTVKRTKAPPTNGGKVGASASETVGPHAVKLTGTCDCPKQVTITMTIPGRLHLTKLEMYCHECKQVHSLVEAA